VGSGFSGSGKPGSASHADCMWRARARVSHLRREFDDVGGMLGYNDGGGDYTRLKRELRTAQDQLALCQMARSPARRPLAALPAPPTPSQTAAQPPPALTKPLTLVAPPPPSQQPPPCCRTMCRTSPELEAGRTPLAPPPPAGANPHHTHILYRLRFTRYRATDCWLGCSCASLLRGRASDDGRATRLLCSLFSVLLLVNQHAATTE
jgi:hypothetical protein